MHSCLLFRDNLKAFKVGFTKIQAVSSSSSAFVVLLFFMRGLKSPITSAIVCSSPPCLIHADDRCSTRQSLSRRSSRFTGAEDRMIGARSQCES